MSYTNTNMRIVSEDKWQSVWDAIYACEHDDDLETARIVELQNTKYNKLLHELHLKEEKERKTATQKTEYEAFISDLQANHKALYEAEQKAEFDNEYKNRQAFWDAGCDPL